MGKQNWKPGNMLNPVPAVMVSVADEKWKDKYNHRGMDGNRMYESAYGLHLGTSHPLFL